MSDELRETPLGIVTKTYSPAPPLTHSDDLPIPVDYGTGELKTEAYDLLNTPNTLARARAERWALKSVVNRLLPASRSSKCMVLSAPIPGHGLANIDVCKNTEHGKAFYSGLMACGSVWRCPICAAKISERRRVELKEALERSKSLGWSAHLVTLTIPHGIGDDINILLDRLSLALKKLSQGKAAINSQIKKLLPDESVYGFVRALEVTHGANGFHPHFHLILFTSSGISSNQLFCFYLDAWQRACRLAGLPEPSFRHGVTVKDGAFAASYASKWGLEDEMTKGHMKKSKSEKGISPWGFLRAYLDGDDEHYSRDRASKLFRVYAEAFKGRRQLYWSNGLRKKLGMDQEITDVELVEKVEQSGLVLASLSIGRWRSIRKKGHQAYVLTVAETSVDELHQILETYCDKEDRLTEKPKDKSCARCCAVVYPDWRAVYIDMYVGWLASTTCCACGNENIHMAGEPNFTMWASAIYETGGDLTKLPSL